MGRVIGFCNQKGGTGKTTTLINVASFLALAQEKVLVIDLDPQANSTSGLGVNINTLESTTYDVLMEKTILEKAIIPTNIRYLYLLPSHPSLAGAEIELVNLEEREFQLKKRIERARENFNFVLIDAPPSLGLLTINILSAVEEVIIPIQCEYYALEGLSRLYQTLELIKDRLNPNLKIGGILLTMADFRTRLTYQVIDEVRKFFKDKVYKTIIPRNIKLSESPSFGKPIYFYDSSCIGARAYFSLTQEILGREIKGVYDGEEGFRQGVRSLDTQKGDSRISSVQRISLY